MQGLDCLIKWLEELQRGNKEPLIPYTYHNLVRLFHNNMGTEESLEVLKRLRDYKEE